MSKKIKMCIAVFCVVAISACLLCTTAFAESYQVIRDLNYYDIYDGTQFMLYYSIVLVYHVCMMGRSQQYADFQSKARIRGGQVKIY